MLLGHHLRRQDPGHHDLRLVHQARHDIGYTIFHGLVENTNPGRGAILNKKSATPGAGLFGYSHLYGGYAGGQAEFVRVPEANVGPLKIPDALSDEQVLFLSDILPTGYQAAVDAQLGPGIFEKKEEDVRKVVPVP